MIKGFCFVNKYLDPLSLFRYYKCQNNCIFIRTTRLSIFCMYRYSNMLFHHKSLYSLGFYFENTHKRVCWDIFELIYKFNFELIKFKLSQIKFELIYFLAVFTYLRTILSIPDLNSFFWSSATFFMLLYSTLIRCKRPRNTCSNYLILSCSGIPLITARLLDFEPYSPFTITYFCM